MTAMDMTPTNAITRRTSGGPDVPEAIDPPRAGDVLVHRRAAAVVTRFRSGDLVSGWIDRVARGTVVNSLTATGQAQR